MAILEAPIRVACAGFSGTALPNVTIASMKPKGGQRSFEACDMMSALLQPRTSRFSRRKRAQVPRFCHVEILRYFIGDARGSGLGLGLVLVFNFN